VTYPTNQAVDRLRARIKAAAPKPNVVPLMLPTAFAELTLGAELDDWQREYLEAASQENRIAIVASRQSGKSTIVAAYVAWLITFVPDSLVMVASRSLRQATHFQSRVDQILGKLHPVDSFLERNRLSLVLSNRSSCISVASRNPDTARGYSPVLLCLDEGAFLGEDLLQTVTPSLAATHGAIHMISSANGKSNPFYEAVEGINSDIYWSQKITWRDCPRMSPEFIAQERRTMTDIAFRSEYESEFLSREGQFFTQQDINDLFEARESRPVPGTANDESVASIKRPTVSYDDMNEALNFRQKAARML
jgi:hypothetical protein